MPIIYECSVPDPNTLFVRDPEPQICTWQGRKALRLGGAGAGLLVVPNLVLDQGWIEVDLGADGAAYPGIAFRVLDSLNYELAYVQPHTSGQWDALQYDPVFHGSNTWQLYYGDGAQQNVEVPPQSWLHLRITFQKESAVIQVGEQTPLLVKRLAHLHQEGLVGLWTYLPAYFSNLRIGDDPPASEPNEPVEANGEPPVGAVMAWFLEGYGVVEAEPNGILNLNRYLSISEKGVRLIRPIELSEEEELTFTVGFSDEVTLQIDDDVIFQGENLFHNSPKWEERGYVSWDQQVSHHLQKGDHQLTVILKAKEYFGFGVALKIEGKHYKLLPAQLCK